MPAIFSFYASLFMWQDQRGRIQNRLVAWWVTVNVVGEEAVGRHVAFVARLGQSMSHAVQRLCGDRILSVRSVWVSAMLSAASGTISYGVVLTFMVVFIRTSVDPRLADTAWKLNTYSLLQLAAVSGFFLALSTGFLAAAILPWWFRRPLISTHNVLGISFAFPALGSLNLLMVSAMKRKFGASLRSRNIAALFNEALLKCLCFNLSMLVHSIHELGIDPKFWMPRKESA